MIEEPEMFGNPEVPDQDIETGTADLETLTDDEFEDRYKGTKRLYRALIDAFPVLREASQALEGSPLDLDTDIADAVGYLLDDFMGLIEQMHMASYWKKECV